MVFSATTPGDFTSWRQVRNRPCRDSRLGCPSREARQPSQGRRTMHEGGFTICRPISDKKPYQTAKPLNVLQLDSRDNVLIALDDLKAGDRVAFGGQPYTLPKSVPAKHKFAMEGFGVGGDVIMYGVLVGRAVKPIAAGELLTVSNIKHQAAPFREHLRNYHWSPPDVSQWKNK